MEAEAAKAIENMPIRGLAQRESLELRDKRVADRIVLFVKKDIFRRVKFIRNDTVLRKAMELVQRNENAPGKYVHNFQVVYKSCFMEALNTKRSTCKQAGGRIVAETLQHLPAKDFFTMEELCR